MSQNLCFLFFKEGSTDNEGVDRRALGFSSAPLNNQVKDHLLMQINWKETPAVYGFLHCSHFPYYCSVFFIDGFLNTSAQRATLILAKKPRNCGQRKIINAYMKINTTPPLFFSLWFSSSFFFYLSAFSIDGFLNTSRQTLSVYGHPNIQIARFHFSLVSRFIFWEFFEFFRWNSFSFLNFVEHTLKRTVTDKHGPTFVF